MSHLIKGITSDHDLIELARLINVRLTDILTIEEIKKPLPSKGSYIILLRADGGVGHWVCQHNNEYFDPFGVGPNTVLGPLKYDEKQYQGVYSEHCGIYCLLFLYAKQKKRMDLLNGFTDMDVDVI